MIRHHLVRVTQTLSLAAVIALSGCALPVRERAPRTPEASTTELPTGQVVRPTNLPGEQEPRSLPAAIALRERAATASAAEQPAQAVALLERALRISSQDPLTYQRLAENHLALNRPAQALQFARRGLTLEPLPEQRGALEDLVQQCEAAL